MATPSEKERMTAIMDRMNIIYGLEGVNPILIDVLDAITLDVEWLYDRLNSAWSTVEVYQQELRQIYR
jgi:hypothetical protein